MKDFLRDSRYNLYFVLLYGIINFIILAVLLLGKS